MFVGAKIYDSLSTYYDANKTSENDEETVRTGMCAKFLQHDELRKKLIVTGDDAIIYQSENDLFWGMTNNGIGQNRLGKLLMEVRDRLREYPDTEFVLPPWIEYPDIDAIDMFWRMGKGESQLDIFYPNIRGYQDIYKLVFPAPDGWEGAYEEF